VHQVGKKKDHQYIRMHGQHNINILQHVSSKIIHPFSSKTVRGTRDWSTGYKYLRSRKKNTAWGFSTERSISIACARQFIDSCKLLSANQQTAAQNNSHPHSLRIRSTASYFVLMQNVQQMTSSILNCNNLQMDCHLLQYAALFKTIFPWRYRFDGRSKFRNGFTL